ncbi:MAG: glycerol-3-phosphate dehydrogenase (NAD(P)+) [Chlamydiales bacterium]|jgi:glycerol-3-phosphate dehydrogenase (NAD(P)+)
MKIGYLGAGAWGFCLASLLANKGYDVIAWTIDENLVRTVNETGRHPCFPEIEIPKTLSLTTDLSKALDNIDMLVEGVTSAGIRPVFKKVKELGIPSCPITLTSKGIEQNTGLLLTEVVVETLGEDHRNQIGCLSGPSHAEEVVKGLPASVTCSAYSRDTMFKIQETFSTPVFRVYPNSDINGVEFGGAMKNIVAIACGISDGLGFGDNTKAALMTRGLHEIRKLAKVKGCNPETLNGLSGMGDLCVTCLSTHSRNYRFGRLLAENHSFEEAKKIIGQVVEGAYTCVSAFQISQKTGIPVPISETIYNILYKDLTPAEAVKDLLKRAIKEEHL